MTDDADLFNLLFTIAQAAKVRWGESTPHEILSRITEELGEVASEVNKLEGSTNSKVDSGQTSSKEALTGEIVQLLRCIMELVDQYDAAPELRQTIEASYDNWRRDGWIGNAAR